MSTSPRGVDIDSGRRETEMLTSTKEAGSRVAAAPGVRGVGASLPPVMRLLWSASPLSFVFQLLLYLVQAVTPALSIYLNRSLLDRVAQIVQGDRTVLAAAVWLTLAMSGAMLLSILAMTASRHVERRLFEHLSQRVEGLIIEKAQKLPLSFF